MFPEFHSEKEKHDLLDIYSCSCRTINEHQFDFDSPETIDRSNAFDGEGELFEYFRGRGSNKARQVIDVSDARDIKGNTGQRQNEYNFGPGTEDVKSIWNTLDFEPTQIIRNADGTIKEILRTSPFAYNSNNNIDRSNYA